MSDDEVEVACHPARSENDERHASDQHRLETEVTKTRDDFADDLQVIGGLRHVAGRQDRFPAAVRRTS
jgi:hypothetical protein